LQGNVYRDPSSSPFSPFFIIIIIISFSLPFLECFIFTFRFFVRLASRLRSERFKPWVFPSLQVAEQFQDEIFLQEVMPQPLLAGTFLL
jgi:hypothetical protein